MTTDTTIDNSAYLGYEDGAEQTSSGDLATLSDLANQQAAAEKAVSDAEAALVKAQQVLKDLSERQIPELMDKVGMATYSTKTGVAIDISEIIRASIPAPRKFEAFEWLRSHNHEALIKRSVSIDFSKGEDAKARALIEALTKKGYNPEDKESVHAQTLAGWVREKLKKGEEFPLDLFGVFRQRVAKVTLPK